MPPVLIVGAGMAGLACATALHRAGTPFLLLEAADAVGGRVRTDLTPDGFRLDRGFQVLLSAYPEVRRQVRLDTLQPRAFRSGAVIRLPDGTETLLPDPLKDPFALPAALFSPIGSFADKLRIAQTVLELLPRTAESLLEGDGVPTLAYLRAKGWSERMIERFFIPFFGGVFLDRTLSTDSRFFRFVFQQFVLGRALLPSHGMQALPEQMASALPRERIRLNTPVKRAEAGGVHLQDGTSLEGAAVVFAVEGHALGSLFPEAASRAAAPEAWQRTTCVYFDAPVSPGHGDGYLRLNAMPGRLVHNVCFPSDVAPEYAPDGRTLVSVSSHGAHGLNPAAFEARVREELVEWFGPAVREWRTLRLYEITRALPPFTTERLEGLPPGIWICGDHVGYPSLNCALATGRATGEQVAATLSQLAAGHHA
jgi:phytoene dehydrogenase-like protein